MSAKISIVDLKKQFGTKIVTNDLTLEIPAGQMTVIIGRSGEGKSVLLKQIIGLIEPTSGHIYIDGIDITHVTEEQHNEIFKKCGYVFQFAALLDSLNIYQNVGITLLENGMPHEQVLPIVKKKLAQVNLAPDVLYKYPSELSGGMRKRAGFARTLVSDPEIVLYDEPTTGLDPITSRVIHELMAQTQKETGATTVVISHDVEIFKFADNVALLHEGKIRYFGPAKTIWECDNPFVHQFIRGDLQGPIPSEVAHTA